MIFISFIIKPLWFSEIRLTLFLPTFKSAVFLYLGPIGVVTRQKFTNVTSKVEVFLEQREVAFLLPSKICENLNFSTVHPEKFKHSEILLGDKVQRADLTCEIIRKVAPFVLSKL